VEEKKSVRGRRRSGGRRSGLARNFQNAKTAASSITAEGKPQLQQLHLFTDQYSLEKLSMVWLFLAAPGSW